MREELLRGRQAHPSWGPRKILAWLSRKKPELELPAASTVGDLYRREGLSQPRWRRRKLLPVIPPKSLENPKPNDLWAADFKGQFHTLDGKLIYPLTLSDHRSRYLLVCQSLGSVAEEGARPFFERAFRTYGLPRAIRTDNGSPFGSNGLGRLSRLAVWWLKLGIRPERIKPGHPEQNGRHERMHRTLKRETAIPPAQTPALQQKRFSHFQKEYNQERPHEALGGRTPGELYRPSERSYPAVLNAPEYPRHYQVRRVGSGGIFGWQGRTMYATVALEGESIGLVEIQEDVWKVYFAEVELGLIDQRDPKERRKHLGRVLPMCPV
jgi:transposase InsO family protein